MGTDGTLGIKVIKEKGSVVLVQDPATANFDSMPRIEAKVEERTQELAKANEELQAEIAGRRLKLIGPGKE
jgi:two-component system, chemotaxis family, CheB/CheR fusion protein